MERGSDKGSGIIRSMIHQKKIVYLILFLLIAIGIAGLSRMNKDEFPTFEIKQGLVAGVYPGASAKEVEEQLTKPLEDILFSFSEVNRETTYSYSKDGICYIYVDLTVPAKEKDEAWSKIKLRLDAAKMTLPPGVLAVAVVDNFSSVSALLIALESADKSYREMQEYAEENKRNEDFIRFQLNELKEANLSPGLQEELEHESDMLSHVEDIKTALYNVENILGAGDAAASDNGGVTDRLKEAVRSLDGITEIYPEAKSAAERMESCFIELKDILQEIGANAANIEFDPRRLEEVNSKLDKIYTLEKKHSAANVEELLSLQAEFEDKLNAIDNSDETMSALLERERQLADKCGLLADKLTAVRTASARKIEKEMPDRLIPLGIPKIRFAVSIEPKELGCNGHDKVAFLFSANTSTPMQPVAQVASGGEIARVMLSLKAMISGAVKLPTIIFDEIDTGVSGKIAEKMADIMQEMADNERQVISITHLPQIAAKGSTHYKVYKEEGADGTTSRMCILTPDQRVTEIAQMLSGSEITDAAISNAKELLKTK